MKFPIKFKIVALGAVLSVLVTSAALLFANFEYRNRGKENQLQTIDAQLTNLKENLEGDSSGRILNTTLKQTKEYINTQYKASPDDPPEGSDYKDQKQFYMNRFKWLYAIEGIAMYHMTEEEIAFRDDYEAFIEILSDMRNATTSVTVYAAYLTEDNTLFYIGDDCAYRGTMKTMHYLPGSRTYNFNPEFVERNGYYDVEIGDKLNRVMKYENLDGDVTYFFVEYNFDKVNGDANSLVTVEILVLSVTSILMIVAYALGAHFLLLRNVNKLTKTATEFTSEVNANKTLEVKNPGIKSRDEVMTLSNSFVALEESIINYVDVIQKEAQEKERMNVELSVASSIQLSALPSRKYDDAKVNIRAFIKSAKEVGGDFYDYFYLDNNRLAVVISDVSGKGVPAALFMMKSKELIKSAIHKHDNLVDAVTEVNKTLVWNDKESLFVTSFIGVIDFNKGVITYVNAGHEKPYVVSSKGVEKLDGESNFVMGGEEDFVYKSESHKFIKGDTLFLFTDGLNESINHEREEFSYSRIEDTLNNNKDASTDLLISKMNKSLDEFVNDMEQFDDVTMLVIKYNDNKLHLSYDDKNYDIIPDIVDNFNSVYSTLPADTKGAAGIIIDELVNNLISYEKREDLKIDIDFEVKKHELEIVITSNGDDYNPFSNHKKKYLEDFHPDIEEGGLGVSIVKDLAKSTDYKYKDGHSIVAVTVAIK